MFSVATVLFLIPIEWNIHTDDPRNTDSTTLKTTWLKFILANMAVHKSQAPSTNKPGDRKSKQPEYESSEKKTKRLWPICRHFVYAGRLEVLFPHMQVRLNFHHTQWYKKKLRGNLHEVLRHREGRANVSFDIIFSWPSGPRLVAPTSVILSIQRQFSRLDEFDWTTKPEIQ